MDDKLEALSTTQRHWGGAEAPLGESPLPWVLPEAERPRVYTIDEDFEHWLASRARETRE